MQCNTLYYIVTAVAIRPRKSDLLLQFFCPVVLNAESIKHQYERREKEDY
jgi:hypothetical protein